MFLQNKIIKTGIKRNLTNTINYLAECNIVLISGVNRDISNPG